MPEDGLPKAESYRRHSSLLPAEELMASIGNLDIRGWHRSHQLAARDTLGGGYGVLEREVYNLGP
jgi:hypothetical protein